MEWLLASRWEHFFLIPKIWINFILNWNPIIFLLLWKEPDGKFNGALGDVIYKRTEFTMNNFFVKDYETRLLEFSSSVFDDKLCIIVRTADLVRRLFFYFQLKIFKLQITCLLYRYRNHYLYSEVFLNGFGLQCA